MKPLSNKVNTEALCILHARDADISHTGRFQNYIAFGDWVDSSTGPAIRFHGGIPFSGCLDNAPVMYFNIYGDCTIAPVMWMNEHNCPNVFDEEILKQVTFFIQINLPILYLVFERHLDKEDSLAYFQGRVSWEGMLSSIYGIPDELFAGLLSCENAAQLHTFCVSQQIYGKTELEYNRPLLCQKLKARNIRIFETELRGEDTVLTKYNGRSAIVQIPEDTNIIDADVFLGHAEIKKLIIPESVNVIGTGAFSGCSGLESLMIPANVWEVAERAFAQCTQLRCVCIEESNNHEIYLSENAFLGCANLTEVYLSSDTIPEGNPFQECPNLILYCKAGSYAEKYSKENDIPYHSMNRD